MAYKWACREDGVRGFGLEVTYVSICFRCKGIYGHMSIPVILFVEAMLKMKW